MNIYEIARIAGVSVGTVSRVINGKRDVSPTTRAKILKIMDDTGYMPKISSSTPL
jgi:DNA-binding LacI/PurR family transcriptional regulator